MPREEKDRDLIDHFVHIKPIPRFGVSGGHNLGRQIIWRGACLNRSQTFRGQITDELSNNASRPFGFRTKEPRHPFRPTDKRREVQDRLAALMGFEL